MPDFCDRAPINIGRRTADGYLAAEARVARTGIQIYAGSEVGRPDMPLVRVWRPESEVFAADAMRSYAHRPMTMGHPAEGGVTADNWRQLAIGHTGDEVVRDGQFVRVPLVLMDGAAINAVESGARELSMGYTAELEFVDGVTPENEPYDAVQRSLRMNHLAVVAKARGGSDLKIGDAEGGGHMPEIKTKTVVVDGIPVETTDAGAMVIERLQKDVAAARQQVADAEAAHAKALAAKDAELAKRDGEAEALRAQVLDAAALDKLVAERAALVATAKAIAPTVTCDGKTAAQIRRDVLAAKLGDAAIAGKSDAYLDARFDMLAEQAGKQDGFRDAMRSAPANQPAGDDRAAALAARNSWLTDAWMGDAQKGTN